MTGEDHETALRTMWEQLAASDPQLARTLGTGSRRNRALGLIGRYLEMCGRAFAASVPPAPG